MPNLEELIHLTEELIRIRSTHDRPENIRACVDFVERFFDGTRLSVQRFERNGIPSIIITRETKTPKVFLCGHLDVVEGDDDQFEPRRDGDRLYGRGALDMKSGDAVMMTLMRDLAMTKHDVGLMLTGDEEVGGFNGTGFLVAQGFSCEVAIIPDGGTAVHRIVQKEKGIVRVALRAEGKTSHASAPWNGKNAIALLAEAIGRLEHVFLPLHEHPEDHWTTTCSVGRIEGGQVVNQVPSSAVAFCDIRHTEEERPEDILTRLAKEMPAGVTVEHQLTAPMVNVDLTHPLVAAFQTVLTKHGLTPEIGFDHGSSDGRFFAEKNIPVIISQPDGANLHAKDEWVDMKSIGLYYEVLREFVERVA